MSVLGQESADISSVLVKGSRITDLVVGVVYQRGFPFALVLRIVDHRPLPFATTRRCLTGWVRNLRGFPLSIHLLIPAHNNFINETLICIWITSTGDDYGVLFAHQSSGFSAFGSGVKSSSSSSQPSGFKASGSSIFAGASSSLRYTQEQILGIIIRSLRPRHLNTHHSGWSPVVRLCSLRVRNLGPLIPVFWFGVVGVVNLFGWVDWRHHIMQEAAVAHAGLINEHFIAVVWIQD